MRDDISDIPSAVTGLPEPPGETDAAREARFQLAIDQALQVSCNAEQDAAVAAKEAAAREPPAKYSLREMMLLITMLAVVLGLVRAFGLWGGLATWLGAMAWTTLIYPVWHPKQERRQATMFDWIWGLLLPLVCLGCDPMVFRDTNLAVAGDLMVHDFQFGFRRETSAAYCFILWQMLFLFVWLVGRGNLARFAGFFLGSFIAAVIFTALLGALLLVPAIIGTLFAGIGLMGFTPLFTCYVFARRIRETRQMMGNELVYFWLLAALGFALAIVAPLLIAAMLQPIVGVDDAIKPGGLTLW